MRKFCVCVPPAGGMKFLLDFFTKKSRVQGRALPRAERVWVQPVLRDKSSQKGGKSAGHFCLFPLN
ncbi:hypothetical protein D3Z52_01645 [Clostridiaceae bacterium]|nr:hypothetical protein [Clostridiaceae bacterium]